MRFARHGLAILVVFVLWFSIAGTAMNAVKSTSFDGTPMKYEIPLKPPDGKPNPGKKPPKDPKPDPGADKYAVVIGIADYKGRSSDLWHPDEDAKEMAQVLEDEYGYSQIKVLLNRKATASAIVSAIDWLVASEGLESQVVFFFSGHGFRVPDDDQWDSDTESDGYDEGIVTHDFYGLPDGWLAAKFAEIESEHFSLFFGSCHSGGMFDDDDDISHETSIDSLVIASACKADQYGWDYLSLGNTLWGYHYVDRGMLAGLADPTGTVSVEEAHDYAYPFVIAEQPDSQPQILDHQEGEREP